MQEISNKKTTYALGIETSCDETAAAIVDSERNILSNQVLSKLDEHIYYGGVVPEIAARNHMEHLDHLIRAAMQESSLEFKDLDGVAATCGPGLIGGVMVGMMAGKAIAVAHDVPFVAVNHLEGHALTPRLTDDIVFPYLLLLVSGGHTQILVVEDVGQYKRLGTTIDDAVGECFDKSAKMLGLGYPGGPKIQQMAEQCEDTQGALERYPLPRPLLGKKKSCDFSFSGLKTAIRQTIMSLPDKTDKQAICDLSYALQYTIGDVIENRCKHAITRFLDDYLNHRNMETGWEPTLVVAGGVAANTHIRARLSRLTTDHKMRFSAPPVGLCSDNAAMIAWAGLERLSKGLSDPLDFAARPRWPLDPNAEPKTGAGVKA